MRCSVGASGRLSSPCQSFITCRKLSPLPNPSSPIWNVSMLAVLLPALPEFVRFQKDVLAFRYCIISRIINILELSRVG